MTNPRIRFHHGEANTDVTAATNADITQRYFRSHECDNNDRHYPNYFIHYDGYDDVPMLEKYLLKPFYHTLF